MPGTCAGCGAPVVLMWEPLRWADVSELWRAHHCKKRR